MPYTASQGRIALAPCAERRYVASMPRTGPQVRLRAATWNAEEDRLGNHSCNARAKHIGMDHSLVCRIEAGSTLPGNRFIASVLTAFPRRKFEHFFEVASAAGDGA